MNCGGDVVDFGRLAQATLQLPLRSGAAWLWAGRWLGSSSAPPSEWDPEPELSASVSRSRSPAPPRRKAKSGHPKKQQSAVMPLMVSVTRDLGVGVDRGVSADEQVQSL